jgi:uncharacterized protein (TIGR02118 family)
MSWIIEIALPEGAGAPDTGALASPLHGLAGLVTLDAYTPADAAGGDPMNKAETPPPLVLIAEFDTRSALEAALASDALRAAVEGLADPATVTPMRRHFYPVPDGPGAPLAAPVSYLVRYFLPCDDAGAFRAHYMADHPPTQAKLPGIRSIICCEPLEGLACPAAPKAEYLVGNEVAFDSAEAFAAAMRSPARAELRAHMAGFPPYGGVNSHHLLTRTRLAGDPA